RTITPLGDLAALGVMYAIALAVVSDTRWLWSQDRFERPRLARIARAAADPAARSPRWQRPVTSIVSLRRSATVN
ncbi:MAG: hypothetical protein ACREV1_15005, partial [Gammaproteobacteria bacterium]